MIDSIAELAKPLLILSGGEPLCRPDLFDITDYASGKGLHVAIATNGTLLTRETAKQIAGLCVSRVSVSVDGAVPETHDEIRGIPGSFDAALAGIEYLKSAGVSFQLNFTIIKKNRSQICDVHTLAAKLGAVAIHYFLLVPVGCGAKIAPADMLSPAECEETFETIYELSKHSSIQIKPTCAPHYYRIVAQHSSGGLSEKHQIHSPSHGSTPHISPLPRHSFTRGCLAGMSVCFVSHTGLVFPCGYLPITCGNVLETPFSEIWNTSNLFRNLRNPDMLKGKCGVCEYKNICGGCRARAFHKTGDYLEIEPFCLHKPG